MITTKGVNKKFHIALLSLAVILILGITLSVCGLFSHAVTPASGLLNNVTDGAINWTIDGSGVMNVTGYGTLPEASVESLPWRTIDGITEIYFTGTSDTSKITFPSDSTSFFEGTTATKIEFGNYVDGSGVTKMNKMFKDASNLESIDLKVFSNPDMQYFSEIFSGCLNLESLSWTYVTMQFITGSSFLDSFKNCDKLETVDMSHGTYPRWDEIHYFLKSNNLNPKVKTIDFSYSTFNTLSDNTEIYMEYFIQYTSLEKIDFSHCNFPTVTKITRFGNTTSLKEVDFSYSTFPLLELMPSLVENSSIEKISFSHVKFSKLNQLGGIFRNANPNLSADFTYAEFPSLNSCGSFVTTQINQLDMSYAKITSPEFSGMINNISCTPETAINNIIYDGCEFISATDEPISNIFSGAYIKNASFKNCIFTDCISLEDFFANIRYLENVDLTGASAPSCESLQSLFSFSKVKKIVLKDFYVPNCTDMSGLFEYCSLLINVDLTGFDTSSCLDMSNMFSGCMELTSIDVSNFDTSSCLDMSNMFRGCMELTSLDVRGFVTTNVTNMLSMFESCSSLTSIDVSNFDTSSVEDMAFMFFGCSSLTSIDVSNFDTSSCFDFVGMFDECTNLKILNISNKFKIVDESYLLESEIYINYETEDDDFSYVSGFVRDCPNLEYIIIDNNFEGLSDFTNHFLGWFDYELDYGYSMTFDEFKNVNKGILFYTDKVDGQNVPLKFVILGDATANEKIAKLGTGEASNPYPYFENDNRTISKLNFATLQDFNNYLNGGSSGGGSSSRKKSKTKEEPKTQEKTIEKAKNKIYIEGYVDKTFRPLSNVTRAEVAKVFSKISELFSEEENYKNYKNKYVDLSSDAWYDNYIGFATKENIFEGYEDDSFKPQNNMTRAEFCVAIVRMFNLKENTNVTVNYKDISDRWFEKYIRVLATNNYIDNSDYFNPDNKITRAEVCKIVNKVINNYIFTNNNFSNDDIKEFREQITDVKSDEWYFFDVVNAAYIMD